MQITAAAPSDLEQTVVCLAAAFAADPITGFLLQAGPNYPERLTRFLSLLARARVALGMPVLVARGATSIHGAAMGNIAAPPPWPGDLEEEWARLEMAVPGFNDRVAIYDAIAQRCKPPVPHFYLGVIGTDPAMRGRGIGTQLLRSFCDLSASDPLSSGVYLETANPSNVQFYERAGFSVAGQGSLGSGTLWCMFLRHEARHDAPYLAPAGRALDGMADTPGLLVEPVVRPATAGDSTHSTEPSGGR
ncbi:MAG: GNAT family N-acetyltransferase [Pseudomonadota bacterium]